jgi:hypothetical protein
MNKWIETLEGFGVGIRIIGIATISIMGSETPFGPIWVAQFISALLLTWCSWKRMNRPYIVLNGFYTLISLWGIVNSIFLN